MVYKRVHGGSDGDIADVCYKLNQLKRLIQAERVVSIREKLKKNKKKVEIDVSQFLLKASRNAALMVDNGFNNLPLCKYSGFPQGWGDNDYDIGHEVDFLTRTKLPFIEKIPPYTTWVFVDRNQKMFEDQSVEGKQIYDNHQRKKEALMCSGSEEDNEEPDEEKHEFVEGEDRILWTIFQEHGQREEILNIVSQFIGVATSDLKDRYNTLLQEKYHDKKKCKASSSGDSVNERGISLETSLSAALDSFDSLFCRRCLVFDCRLHGCPPTLILPGEKQPAWSEPEDDRRPCSDHCYLRLRADQDVPGGSTINVPHRDIGAPDTDSSSMQSMAKRKVEEQSTVIPSGVQHSSRKRKKLYPWEIIRALSENRPSPDAISRHHVGASDELDSQRTTKDSESVSIERRNSSEWKPIEKELYLKGLEIFGRNSCLIARNLLPGLKTCIEVFNYMRDTDNGYSLPQKSVATSSLLEENGNANTDQTEQEIPTKHRLIRRRRRTRKLKYTRKSTRQPSNRKRSTADDKTMLRKHYTPCGCGTMCGKQCPCLQNETRCEKYCGCSKNCKNRFRGCHCAKNQCKTKQCPCFAARRECDPDICRNCWVSCGDGTLGEPPRQGESQCENMKLLLRQHQRILLAKSEVAGWGAFLKNPVNKDDYLGEYAGELISYAEAEERGTNEGHAKSAYLFDLNDQYVLDAHRKGNMLKFANHSSNPNCYAKAMLVGGDHRLGMYAKGHIEAGEELFFDYMYGPDQAPSWARKPEDSKGDNSSDP